MQTYLTLAPSSIFFSFLLLCRCISMQLMYAKLKNLRGRTVDFCHCTVFPIIFLVCKLNRFSGRSTFSINHFAKRCLNAVKNTLKNVYKKEENYKQKENTQEI